MLQLDVLPLLSMNDKIDFILKHNRLPFSNSEKITIGAFLLIFAALAIVGMIYYPKWYIFLGAPLAAAGFSFAIYNGMKSSLLFHEILTGFSADDNIQIVLICLRHLNIQVFTNEESKYVFVCFVHDRKTGERQDIYLVAKDGKVLINSNKEEDGEMQPGQSMIEKIGTSIFITAKQLRDMGKKY